MAIKFLTDHRVEGPPEERFKKGQVVKNRSPESEMHFVRRGLAAFYESKTKPLIDHEGNEITPPAQSTVIVHNVANARGGDGVLPDGTALRAPGGPVTVTTTASLGGGEVTPAKGKK